MNYLKNALKPKSLFKFFVFSSLIGLGSCSSTLIINDNNPSPSYFLWNSEPGLNIWKEKISNQYPTSQKPPEWCHKQQAWVDGHYYELGCYFKTKKDLEAPTNSSTYRIDRFIHSKHNNATYSLRYDRSLNKNIPNNDAGKWRRFFGEEELLPIEKALQKANIALTLTSFVSWLLSFISLVVLIVVTIILLIRKIFIKLAS